MKRLIICVICLTAALTLSAQKRVSVLGDSYSTFLGISVPETNACWYFPEGHPSHRKDNDVSLPEHTWWMQYIAKGNYVLERNNSFSGSTVSTSGYRNQDYSYNTFCARVHDLGDPEILLICGGTNDSWAGAPIGENKFEGWTSKDLKAFRPAFCYLMHLAKTLYPNTTIVNITNSELSEDVTAAMAEICAYYGVPNILLHDIEKQGGHPSQAGMKAIAEQVPLY